MNVTSFSAHILLVPLIVASSISIPLVRSRAASSADITGSAVVVSIRTSPALPASNSLSESATTAFTTEEFGSDRMTASTAGGISPGDAAFRPPLAAKASMRPGSTSYPITEYPAASKFPAIPLPMRPRPTNPILCFFICYPSLVPFRGPRSAGGKFPAAKSYSFEGNVRKRTVRVKKNRWNGE